MPDITMCTDESCPKRNTCYRFRAIPDKYMQSYFLDSPRDGDKCEYFMSIEGWGRLRETTIAVEQEKGT